MILRALLVIGTVACVSACASPVQDESFWPEWWTQNLRWKIDESVRVIINDQGDIPTTLGFLGIDVHNVISTDERDIATLMLQPYLTRIDTTGGAPPLFDGPEDWELVWRIFNANIKLLQNGALNMRVGHIEIPFGLEYTINSNGTLRDYIHGANFGLKADWGAGINGELESLEYELDWTAGSGNEYRDEDQDGVISGRIGSLRDQDLVLGVSLYDGESLTPAGIVERERIGVDVQYYYQNLGFFGEVSAGEDGDTTDVLRALGEVNWRNPDESVLSWAQLVVTNLDGSAGETDALDTRIGVRWSPTADWTLSMQYVQNLEPMDDDAHRNSSLALQVRYRF